LKRRIAKATALTLLSLIAIAVIMAAAFFWRLSRGPVALDFIGPRIEQALNSQLKGFTINVGGTVLELDRNSGVPHIRFRDLALSDSSGNVIARANRAAVGLDRGALLRGAVVPRSLELIGSRVLAKRNLNGSFELGIGEAAEPAPSAESAPAEGKADLDAMPAPQSADQTQMMPDGVLTGTRIVELLAQESDGASLSSIEDIRIVQSSIRLFDEANAAEWFAPSADLTFRKMPYGFVVVTKADVASGSAPWHAEGTASYRADQKTFSVSLQFNDLVPAQVAQQVFALSQLARFNIPMSGHAEMETDASGHITKASMEFAAAAGVIDLPDYIARPIVVDEGALHFEYRAEDGIFHIVDSSILVGGSRAELTGTVLPLRDPLGKLTDVVLDLKANNVNVDTQGSVRDPVKIDAITLRGKAAVSAARFDIEDLQVVSGGAGVRLNGAITGGPESPGLQFNGRATNVSADLLKKLWPPVVAPKTRSWVTENVVSGRVTDGTFVINLPVNGMAEAKRNHRLDDAAVDCHFTMADVTTRYFHDLPPLQKASATARLSGNNFEITIDQGQAVMPSGKLARLRSGSFSARELMAVETPGVITVEVAGDTAALQEFANLPDLNLVQPGLDGVPPITGDAVAKVTIKLPLIKDVPRNRVQITSAITLNNAAVTGVIPGVDLSNGQFAILFDSTGLSITGPTKLNGVPATIEWHKAPGKDAVQRAAITTTLDDEARRRLGIKIDGLKGPVPVSIDLPDIRKASNSVTINADLSKAAIALPGLGWSRPPTAGTSAVLTLVKDAKGGRDVKDLSAKGPGLVVKGDIDLNPDNSINAIALSQLRIGDENNYALRVEPRSDGYKVTITGQTFDARPYIKSMIAPAAGSSKPAARGGPVMEVSARFARVYAHRGEIVQNVVADFTAAGSRITRADITGMYLSGQPVTLRVIPANDMRELRLASTDGGATLRAANFYSKIAGGSLEFSALMNNDDNSSIRRGELTIRQFEVRNEAALAQLDQRGRPRKSGPRQGGITFKRLTIPFTTDARLVRIGDSIIKGDELGATASGLIRKSDNAMDITGTIIPAYALNSAIGDIPLVGDILTGGNNEGIFGLSYFLGGTINEPRFQVNPVSAIAPGILRKFFEFGSSNPSQKMQMPTPGGNH